MDEFDKGIAEIREEAKRMEQKARHYANQEGILEENELIKWCNRLAIVLFALKYMDNHYAMEDLKKQYMEKDREKPHTDGGPVQG